eukprot:5793402-Alexandrium_andersonii.AAC.1
MDAPAKQIGFGAGRQLTGGPRRRRAGAIGTRPRFTSNSARRNSLRDSTRGHETLNPKKALRRANS